MSAAVVVLHKAHIQASGFVKGFLVETLKKEAARVAEHFGFEDEDFGDGGGRELHLGEGRGDGPIMGSQIPILCSSESFREHAVHSLLPRRQAQAECGLQFSCIQA